MQITNTRLFKTLFEMQNTINDSNNDFCYIDEKYDDRYSDRYSDKYSDRYTDTFYK